MTECNRASFSFFIKKNLTVDFKGGEISSDAGLLLLRQLDEKPGFTDLPAADRCFAANQLRLILHTAADALLYAFKKYLKGTVLEKAQIGTAVG